ncbi:MAG: glycogen synthase GlgA [Oscillospiraceae bacterium]|nr:glycogen synthase GlgA [Oscillospiraceae bacterium]
MKVLFVTSESRPFVASGGLADVAGSLPQALRKRVVGARVILPLHDAINPELRASMKFVTHIVVPLAWRKQYCGLFEAQHNGVVYYFLDNQYYFKRGAKLYGHYDDGERFAFFARAVLEILPHLDDFVPDILHCNDWHCALVPVYHTTHYGKLPFYQHMRTLFTIHNIEYQGKYDMAILGDVFGLDAEHSSLVEHNGGINLMKGGIECAHAVNTVSESYSREILTPEYGHGLEDILAQRQHKLSGILNGIDVQGQNPVDDPHITANFCAEDLTGKAACKAALQSQFNLDVEPRVPLIGMVSRLAAHKGMAYIQGCMEQLLQESDAQLVVLGTGDYEYEQFFHYLAEKFSTRVAFCCDFKPALSRQIYAGSDLFLMPSQSEPCGLSQMIALRYGSIPVVRETGGLRDSITDSGDGEGNGFTFADTTAEALLITLRRALQGYADEAGWQVLVRRAMACDFSWGKSAGAYIKLYKGLLG